MLYLVGLRYIGYDENIHSRESRPQSQFSINYRWMWEEWEESEPRALIRSIQMEAPWLPAPQHVQTICALLGFVFFLAQTSFILMALIRFVWARVCHALSAAHNAQQESKGDSGGTLAHGLRWWNEAEIELRLVLFPSALKQAT